MERIAISLLHVSCLVLAVLASGCHSFPNRDTPLAPNTPAPAPTSARSENLPPAESAKLCMATASVMEQNEKHQEAIELYEKARQLDARTAAQATRCLAVIHDRIGNFDKALDEYRRGFQENPKDAELFNNLGYGYYCRGQWEAAEKQLRRSVSLDPKLASAWINLGMCLAQQMRYDESLATFEKAVPKAQARCNVAFIQATQSKTLEARRNYEMALQLEPGLQMARIALQKLGQPNSVAAVQYTQPRAGSNNDELPRIPDIQMPAKQ
jgi:Tfp pilus assembly protein PilF